MRLPWTLLTLDVQLEPALSSSSWFTCSSTKLVSLLVSAPIKPQSHLQYPKSEDISGRAVKGESGSVTKGKNSDNISARTKKYED